jgi:hypothetical protein
MNPRGLTIAAVVLAALTGVLYWSEHRKPTEDASTATPSAPVVLKVNMPDVTALTLKNKGTEPVVLEKSSKGQWEITAPKHFPADQDAVTGLLGSLSFLSADRVVDEKAADRAQYGLEAPSFELDIAEKGQAVRRLLVGDDTPTGGNAYAALDSEPRVFTIASYTRTSLAKSLNDLRDKTLISLSPDKVSKIELVEKGATIEFGRTKDGWQILKPSPSPAETEAVNSLLRMITGARMDLTATNAPAQFAKGTPVAIARLTGDSGSQTLEVRRNQSDYYVKSSHAEGIYKVDPSVGQAFDKKLEDFQQKKPATPPSK